MRPEIGTQLRPGDLPVGGGLDGDGQFRAGGRSAPEHGVNVGVVLVHCPGEGGDVGDLRTEIGHGESMVSNTASGKLYPPGIQSRFPNAFEMSDDVYPYRPNFKQAVKEVRVKRGIPLAEVAALLGLAQDTLHDYLYKKHMRPGRLPLQELSRLSGRPMADFDDDPGAPPVGTNPESSEIDRFMLRVMGSDISKLTESQKQAAFEAWRAIVRGYESPK